MVNLHTTFGGSIPDYYDRCLGPAQFDPFGRELAALVPRDQAAFERAEHLDACAVISAAARLASELAAAGAPFSVPLRTMPYGVEFYVRDPDEYVIGFIQPAA